MKPLQNPEKELRFTRAAQALPFWLAAAVLFAVTLTLLACSLYREVNPDLPHPLWAMPPLVLAWLAARLAFRMTRHAYVILTPLGLEIFPLFRPEKGMQLVYWQEIAEVDANASATRLTLHFNAERTSGIHLSLRPIVRSARELLIHALKQRVEGKK